MKTSDYPEKIYANIQSDDWNKKYGVGGGWIADKPIKDYGQCEYTRSDLVPKWHKYPDEKPVLPINQDDEKAYLVTFKDDMNLLATTATYCINGEWYSWEWITEGVVAWQELPKPYEED